MRSVAIALGLVAVVALLLRLKFRGDGIYQRGVYVGSALGGIGGPDAREVGFVIVRGMPAFAEREPFVHRDEVYRMLSWDDQDNRSPVLRRYLGVTCLWIGRARKRNEP